MIEIIELINLGGVKDVEEAEVVLYDYLVGKEILTFAGKNTRLVYAGKRDSEHAMRQDEINALLIKEAKAGYTVARLKGGDPFIFSRGGEETEELAKAGIPFEVIPGVTSAIAAPAYAGIPLTHRNYSSTVAFFTGHEDPTKDKSNIDWKTIAGIGTLVFLMGVKNLAKIAASLIANGKDPETPAALIRWGTTTEQETLVAPLESIAGEAEAKNFRPPCVLVVGDVVSLRERLSWFEKQLRTP